MPNSFTPQDVYSIVNTAVKQATGSDDITVVDTSSFTAAGTTALSVGHENTLNALFTQMVKPIVAIRPIDQKLLSIERTNEEWGAYVVKTSFISKEAEKTTYMNTNLAASQLADGNSVDMYKILAPEPVQYAFYNMSTLQNKRTFFLKPHLQQAFRNEAEFSKFWNGSQMEFYNSIGKQRETMRRLTLVNLIAGVSDMGGYEIDMTKEFNDEYGTSYTRAALLTTHLEEFAKFFSYKVKHISKMLSEYCSIFHLNPTKGNIERQTSKRNLKMIFNSEYFDKINSAVYSTVFNPKYLEVGELEEVNYWQSLNDPTKIDITPNITDMSTGATKKGTEVSLPYVLGVMFDKDACGVNTQFDSTLTTPMNAGGRYWNLYSYINVNSWNDFTENVVTFVMGEGS